MVQNPHIWVSKIYKQCYKNKAKDSKFCSKNQAKDQRRHLEWWNILELEDSTILQSLNTPLKISCSSNKNSQWRTFSHNLIIPCYANPETSEWSALAGFSSGAHQHSNLFSQASILNVFNPNWKALFFIIFSQALQIPRTTPTRQKS